MCKISSTDDIFETVVRVNGKMGFGESLNFTLLVSYEIYKSSMLGFDYLVTCLQ